MRLRYIRNLIILTAPFLLMVLVNETVRPTIREKPYSQVGITAINSVIQTPDKCTWNCHNNTTYCKQHHVKLMKPYFSIVDPIYFGIITLLQLTGGYALANIIFLVILWPLLMFFLLTGILDMQQKIKEIKR